TPPMLAIAAAGNDVADDDAAANEDNATADEAAGSAAEAHPVPHSPLVSPVRELTPERQSASERPPSLSPTPLAQTFSLAEPLVFGPEPRPAGLRESYECLASVPIACTARQMVFSSPWLTAKKESGSPLQTALVCNSNPLMVARVDMVINPPWNLPFLGAKGLTSPEQTATGKGISNPLMAVMVCPKPYGIQLTNVSIWKLLLRDVAVSFDSAVHRDHADSFDAVVPSLVSAACCTAAALLCILLLLCSCCSSILLPQEDLSRNLELTESTPSLGEDFIPADSLNSIPADYVSAGHVLETGSVKLAFDSGHCHNVYQAKFMPETDERRIITSADDGQYLPVGIDLRMLLVVEVRHATILECGNVETKLLSKHDGRAHKLANEPNSPHIFYSCGEDGLVQHV
ncbi:hypothetical protein Tco_1100381, partial [Tanacetum coccineum]